MIFAEALRQATHLAAKHQEVAFVHVNLQHYDFNFRFRSPIETLGAVYAITVAQVDPDGTTTEFHNIICSARDRKALRDHSPSYDLFLREHGNF